MSTEHVVTRSVRDSAALLDLTCGPDVGAPYFATPPRQPYSSEVGADPGRLRIAFATHTPAGEQVAPECEQAVAETARLLDGMGHRLEEAKLDFVPEELGPAFRTVIAGNTRVAIESYAAKLGRQPSPEAFEKITWLLFESGATASAADYARAVQVLHRTGRMVARFFERYDLLLTPTLPRPPEKLGVFDMNTDNTEGYRRRSGVVHRVHRAVQRQRQPGDVGPAALDVRADCPSACSLRDATATKATLLRVAVATGASPALVPPPAVGQPRVNC